MIQSGWMWYPGDYEIYHSLDQGFHREEHGHFRPAFWHMDDCSHNAKFRRYFDLDESETMTVWASGDGYWEIGDERHWFGESATVPAGKGRIQLIIGNRYGLPAAYVESESLSEDWEADDFSSHWQKAASNGLHKELSRDPNVFPYRNTPVGARAFNEEGGTLYDFGRETVGHVVLEREDASRDLLICYGESEMEARDEKDCYFFDTVKNGEKSFRSNTKAFRYVWVKGDDGSVRLSGIEEDIDREWRSSFRSDDELLEKIWDTALYTFHIASRAFFLDGVKRDRWVWSGDAYQSYFMNRYTFFDEEIEKRTITALHGRGPVRQYINTIIDYSFYWVLSIWDHYMTTGDREFLESVFMKAVDTMDYAERRCDENGFVVGRPGDWTFIDWADMDKEGPLAAEQILFMASWNALADSADVLGLDGSGYRRKAERLRENIDRFYWDEEQGGYITGFTSGKREIRRHANIFAILYGLADERKTALIAKNVIENDSVPQIVTPYFKFFELEATARLGNLAKVMDTIRSYWGGMIDEGATTFWELYDPSEKDGVQYSMYGEKYGKSLCHAWGASPIYLMGRWFFGLVPTSPAYETFTIEPKLEYFRPFELTLPVKGGEVRVKWDGEHAKVVATRDGGTLMINGESIELVANEEVTVKGDAR